LGEFSPIRQFFITEGAQTFGLLYYAVKAMSKVLRKMAGLRYGRFFHKLIWSPWS
jgi:hypothetical protein